MEQLKDHPFAIVGVNSDTDEEIIKKYEESLTWRNIHDSSKNDFGSIAKAWNIRVWPTVYLLDAEGKIRHKYLRGSSIDRSITKLLKEMGIQVAITHREKEVTDNSSDE